GSRAATKRPIRSSNRHPGGSMTPSRPSRRTIRSGAFLLDLASTLRALLQRRSFTLAAVITLALGIGATTAMFSVIDTLLLEPLPYRDPERLVAIWPAQAVANREVDFLRREATSYR